MARTHSTSGLVGFKHGPAVFLEGVADEADGGGEGGGVLGVEAGVAVAVGDGVAVFGQRDVRHSGAQGFKHTLILSFQVIRALILLLNFLILLSTLVLSDQGCVEQADHEATALEARHFFRTQLHLHI